MPTQGEGLPSKYSAYKNAQIAKEIADSNPKKAKEILDEKVMPYVDIAAADKKAILKKES